MAPREDRALPHSMGRVRVLVERERSLQVEFMDDETIELVDENPDWIPRSQIHDNSEAYEYGHDGELVVNEWLAKQRGWL